MDTAFETSTERSLLSSCTTASCLSSGFELRFYIHWFTHFEDDGSISPRQHKVTINATLTRVFLPPKVSTPLPKTAGKDACTAIQQGYDPTELWIFNQRVNQIDPATSMSATIGNTTVKPRILGNAIVLPLRSAASSLKVGGSLAVSIVLYPFPLFVMYVGKQETSLNRSSWDPITYEPITKPFKYDVYQLQYRLAGSGSKCCFPNCTANLADSSSVQIDLDVMHVEFGGLWETCYKSVEDSSCAAALKQCGYRPESKCAFARTNLQACGSEQSLVTACKLPPPLPSSLKAANAATKAGTSRRAKYCCGLN